MLRSRFAAAILVLVGGVRGWSHDKQGEGEELGAKCGFMVLILMTGKGRREGG